MPLRAKQQSSSISGAASENTDRDQLSGGDARASAAIWKYRLFSTDHPRAVTRDRLVTSLLRIFFRGSLLISSDGAFYDFVSLSLLSGEMDYFWRTTREGTFGFTILRLRGVSISDFFLSRFRMPRASFFRIFKNRRLDFSYVPFDRFEILILQILFSRHL